MFAVGDRVICTNIPHAADLVGYYGHVSEVRRILAGSRAGQYLIDVSVRGRVGGPVEPIMIDQGGDPFPFFDDELQHAD